MGRRAFTLIELLVVIAIIAILAAILFPVFLNAKMTARRSTCSANLKQLGYAVKLYQQDNSGCFPCGLEYPGPSPYGYAAWVMRIRPYVKTLSAFNCPAAVQPWTITMQNPTQTLKVGYCYNEYINFRGYGFPSENTIPKSSTVFLLGDGYRFSLAHDWDDDQQAHVDGLPSGMNRVRFADMVRNTPTVRHGATNVLFCDLHVQSLAPNQFKAVNYPGLNNPGTCREWPVMYPKAQPYR